MFAKRNNMHYQFVAVGTTGLYQMETPISVYLLKDDLMNFLPVLHCLNIYKRLSNLGCNRNMWEFLSLTEASLKAYWPYSGVWSVTHTNFNAAPPTNHFYLKHTGFLKVQLITHDYSILVLSATTALFHQSWNKTSETQQYLYSMYISLGHQPIAALQISINKSLQKLRDLNCIRIMDLL